MKKLTTILLLSILLSCSKGKENTIGQKCYKCEAISAGTFYKEDVCTNGTPEDKLPKQDRNGNLGWVCTEK